MGCDLPLCWAYAEIGSSLSEHTRKFITRLVLNHVFSLSSGTLSPVSSVCFLSSILCSLSQVSVPCFPISLIPVSRLCALSPIHFSLSHFSVPCLPPFVSHPLFHVSLHCSLSPVLCSMSHFSVPCLPSSVTCLTSLFLVSHPLFHVALLCSLSPVICSMSHFFVPCLPSSVPNLTSLSLVSRSLSPILSLCSLYPILLSKQFVGLYWFRVCSACSEIVSAYAQHAMKFIPRMLSMRWNSFLVCSACIWTAIQKLSKFERWLSIR